MAIEVTGLNSGLTPINRPEPKEPATDDAVTPVTATAPADSRAPRQDVEIEMALRQGNPVDRELLEESSRLADVEQQRGEALNALTAERDRLLQNQEPATIVREDALAKLQQIREAALAQPFGVGEEDLGPLPENAFFSRDANAVLGDIDATISALERQSTLSNNRLEQLQVAFNESRDRQLSPGVEPIGNAEEAIQQAAQISEQIRQQTPVNINGLSTADRSAVLTMLQI